jgi:two-component system, OmpR family, sensor histidine kinase RstB
MIRLLIRIYLLLLVLLGLGLMVPVVTTLLHLESNQERLEATFVGPMRMIRGTLQESNEPSLEIIRLQKNFRFPVELLYLNSDGGAPDWLERELAEDEMYFDLNANGKHVSYLRFDDDRVLRYGPLPKLEWFGPEGQLMAVVLLLIGGYLLVRLLVHPLSRQSKVLAGAAKQVSDGHFGSRIPPNAVPHAPEVVQAFNQMTTRIEQLMISHRQLLQDVSHELRTPLARLRFGLEILDDDESEPQERARVATKLDAAIQQLDDLVEEILQYTRLADKDHRKVDEEPANLEEIVNIVVQRFELATEQGKSIEVINNGQPLPPIVGNSRELGRALDNLLANALRFANSRIQVVMSMDKDYVSVVVADDGPGIPDDKRDRVLQPFVQLERNSKHNGLGLAIVERITLAHGGNMEVGASDELGGAAIRVRLPVT